MVRFEPGAPRKRFGQHFLVDPHAIDEIIKLAAPQPSDHILEVGPGEGVLTSHLVGAGARVVAVEIDRDLAAGLTQRFAGAANFELHCADVLKFDLTRLAQECLTWKVVGNLPYNISTPLLMRLLMHSKAFTTLIVMVQREVAERLAASPGSKAYGRLSIMVQRRCLVRSALEIGPDSFWPAPKVDSSVVVLRPFEHALDETFESWLGEIVRSAFSARRKMLANALRGYADSAAFTRAEVDPTARPEQLSVEDFVRLAQATRR